MPVVESLSNDLKLLVQDPQDDGVPIQGDSAKLIASWEKANRAMIEMLQAKGHELLTLGRAPSTAWWRYIRNKPALQQAWSERVYVPGLLLAVPKGRAKVARLLAWTEGVPLILPECDLVAIVKRNSSGGSPQTAIEKVEEASHVHFPRGQGPS